MSTQTTNLKLNKPDIGDTPGVTIPQLASNFDVIDKSLGEIAKFIDSYSGADTLTQFNNAIADLNTNSGVLRLGQGKTYNIAGALTPIDVSKMRIEGNGSILQFSNIGSGVNAITLKSSAPYNTRYLNNVKALNGITILGGTSATPLAGNGIFIGDNTDQNNALFTIENGGIQGFTNNISFGNNAWRIKFKNFNILWGNINVPTGLTNFGENMVFENCIIADGSTQVAVGSGEFHFNHCSFDNVTLLLNGECQVYVNDSHFENPASSSTGYRYVSIQNDNASCFISNTAIILNQPTGGGNFTECLFYVQDTNTNQGLVMDNLKLFQDGFYRPDLGTDATLALVAGKGRAILKSMATWVNSNGFPISRSMNRIFNGDFELGNTNGWTVSGGTFAADNTNGNVKQGTYSGKISAGAGVTSTVSQSFSAEPGQHVWTQVFSKYTIPSGGSLTFKIEWYNRDGIDLGENSGYGQLTSSQSTYYTFGSIGGVAPQGTAYGKLTIIAVGGTSAETDVWLDDIIVNVI